MLRRRMIWEYAYRLLVGVGGGRSFFLILHGVYRSFDRTVVLPLRLIAFQKLKQSIEHIDLTLPHVSRSYNNP